MNHVIEVDPVNLWDDTLSQKDIQQILAMLLDQSYFEILRDRTVPDLLYIRRK